jgi:hypothetical protein
MKTIETIETIKTTKTTGGSGKIDKTNTTTTITEKTKTTERPFLCEERCFCRGGILLVVIGFTLLGGATGKIIDKDISCYATWLAGLGVGLLVAGFLLLGIYRRHDEHYLNNLEL